MRVWVGLVAALVVPLMPAAPAVGAAPAQADQASWTVLVYLDADNNIEADLLADVERMAEVGSTDDLNIIVLADRTPEDTAYFPGGVERPDDDLLGIPEFDDAKLIQVFENRAEVLAELGEVDMSDPQTLSWFVYTGLTEFPADHYAVVLDDHGAPHFSMEDDSTPPSPDGLPPFLTLGEVSDALSSAMDEADVAKLDFFGYNACLMASYDAVAQLVPFADWFVGSEESTLGPQWDFKPMLEAVLDDPTATGEDMGRAVVDNALDRVPFYPQATMSLIDLRKMGAVTQAITSYASALRTNMEEVATALGRARARTLEFGVDPSGQGFSFDVIDLGNLTRNLTDVPTSVRTAGSAVLRAVDQAVVALAQGPAQKATTGLSIYFPPTLDDYQTFLGAVFAEQPTAGPWKRMLESYYGIAGDIVDDADPPRFDSSGIDLDIDSTGVLALASLVPGTEVGVVDAQLLGGRPADDGSFEILLVEPAQIGAGDDYTIGAGWDFTYVQVSDGITTLDATLRLEPVAGSLKGSIPMLYQGPDGSQAMVAIEFTLDSSGNVEGASLIRFEPDGAVAELNPEAGSLLAPLVLVEVAGEVTPQLLTFEALDATSADLGFATTKLPSGSAFGVALVAIGATGITTATFGTGVVP